MNKQINIFLYNNNCNYTKQGIVSLIKDGINEKVSINFKMSSFFRNTLIMTKGNFKPFSPSTASRVKIIVIPEKIAAEVFLDIVEELTNGRVSSYVRSLTLGKREVEILKDIICEMSDDEISKSMNIQKNTVSSHKDNIKKKIAANSRIDMFYAFSPFSFDDGELKYSGMNFFSPCLIFEKRELSSYSRIINKMVLMP